MEKNKNKKFEKHPLDNKFISNNFELTKNIGFANLGNTCYMNSFLQILLHIPTFLPKLRELYKNKIEEDTIIYNIIKLSENPFDNNSLYKIKQIISKKYPKYEKFVQNDTQHFAIDFIDSIISEIKNEISFSSHSSEQQSDNEIINIKENINFKSKKYNEFINNYKNTGEKTFIEDLFLFVDSRIRYNGELIDKKKIRFDIQINIELTFPTNNTKSIYSIYDLLNIKYTNSNIFMDSNNKNNNKNNNNQKTKIQYCIEILFWFLSFFNFCPKLINDIEENNSNDYNEITQKENINSSELIEINEISKIVNLPQILIISLDRGIEGKDLISSKVTFDEELDLKNYIDKDLYGINLGTKYTLFAINIREGDTIYSGHCYSYVKVENSWVCYNDNVVYEKCPKYSLNSVVGLYYIKENISIEKK